MAEPVKHVTEFNLGRFLRDVHGVEIDTERVIRIELPLLRVECPEESHGQDDTDDGPRVRHRRFLPARSIFLRHFEE